MQIGCASVSAEVVSKATHGVFQVAAVWGLVVIISISGLLDAAAQVAAAGAAEAEEGARDSRHELDAATWSRAILPILFPFISSFLYPF